jgi:hypothetical protein
MGNGLTLGFDLKVTQVNYTLETGWDRFDTLQPMQTYDLGTCYVAMPAIELKYEEKTVDNSSIFRFFGDVKVGVSEVIAQQTTSAGAGTQLTKSGIPFFAGVEFGVTF